MARPRIEPATFRSRSGRSTTRAIGALCDKAVIRNMSWGMLLVIGQCHGLMSMMMLMLCVECKIFHFLKRRKHLHWMTLFEFSPCNKYHLKPHFYIVKMGYAGVYLFFLFLLQNIDCGYSLEPPQRGGSNMYPQSMF